MSRVYFHTIERTVGIGGRERANFGMLCWRLTEATLDLSPDGGWIAERTARFREMLLPEHYGHDDTYAGDWEADRRFARMMLTAIHVGSRGDEPLVWKGKPLESFALQLNTALALGSDAVKLAARIHGQCEIHGWVAGRNRAWLAAIIERGLADGVFKAPINQGDHEWSDVVALLREADGGPCVMSYSVCEQFPSRSAARHVEPDLDDDRWYERTADDRWAVAMAGLRAIGSGLELRPDDWASFRFVHRLSALDLAAEDWRARLDAWAASSAEDPPP